MVSEVKTFHREREIPELENNYANWKWHFENRTKFKFIHCYLLYFISNVLHIFLPTFKQILSLECKDLFLKKPLQF